MPVCGLFLLRTPQQGRLAALGIEQKMPRTGSRAPDLHGPFTRVHSELPQIHYSAMYLLMDALLLLVVFLVVARLVFRLERGSKADPEALTPLLAE